jgi:hypothetical protein
LFCFLPVGAGEGNDLIRCIWCKAPYKEVMVNKNRSLFRLFYEYQSFISSGKISELPQVIFIF